MRVFRVFDDEWEQIMGEEQLKGFAYERILNSNLLDEKELQDEDEVNGISSKAILEIIRESNMRGGVQSIDSAIMLLNYDCYDIEVLNIY